MSNSRLKLAKIQANAKQHPEAELVPFENYSHYHSKIIGHVLKNKEKDKYVCIHKITRLILIKMMMKIKDRSHRSRHEHN